MAEDSFLRMIVGAFIRNGFRVTRQPTCNEHQQDHYCMTPTTDFNNVVCCGDLKTMHQLARLLHYIEQLKKESDNEQSTSR